MPKDRYADGREYVTAVVTSDVDLTGITPDGAVVAGVGEQPAPADWQPVPTETAGEGVRLLFLVGVAHDTLDTFPITAGTDYQAWYRYEVGDEVIMRPFETVAAL